MREERRQKGEEREKVGEGPALPIKSRSRVPANL